MGYKKPKGRPIVAKTEDGTDKTVEIKPSKGRGRWKNNPSRPYEGPNDIKWRAEDDVLTLSAATLPFGYPLGLPMGWSTTTSSSITVPGIMAIRTQVTCGAASDYNSPLNLASRMVYQINRRYNSGSKNYDISNLSLVIAAMEQAYACSGWLQRIYWSLTDFSQLSRFKPDALIKMQGCNPTDLRQHQAELAYLISWMGNALKSIALPDLPVFQAAYEAFAGYYIDDDAGKHQIYMLTPDSFAEYQPANDCVSFSHTIPTAQQTLLTYSDLYTMVHSLIDVLLSDADVGLIVGDTAKAWGDKVFKFEAFTAERCTKAMHSLEFLQQVHNLQVSLTKIDKYSEVQGTTQTGPYVNTTYIFNGTQATTTTATVRKVRVDAYSNEPDPKEVINAFVLQANYHGYVASGSALTVADLVTSGSQFNLFLPTGICIACDADLSDYVDMIGLQAAPFAQAYNASYMPGTWVGTRDLMTVTTFDWHPLGLTTHNTKYSFFGDVRNVSFFETSVAVNIHTNCMLNLLGFNKYGVINDAR